MIDDENYINIHGWMMNRLGLRGKELMAYAIIYGFSQDGAGWYYGGRSYLAAWLGCNAKTAGTLLTNMTEKGLIVRKEAVTSNGRTYRYQVAQLGSKIALTSGEMEPTRGENRPNLGAKNAHINIKGELKEEEKRERGRFAPPTRDEVEAYAREKGYNGFPVDRFIAYYESNGWMVGRTKMKSWKAAVSSWWLREDKGKPEQPKLHVSDEILAEWERENEAMRKRLGMI